jgi:hypothetical protein
MYRRQGTWKNLLGGGHILRGLGVWGFDLRVTDWVQGSRWEVQGSGSRVQGSDFTCQSSGFRVQGAGFRVQGAGYVREGTLSLSLSLAFSLSMLRDPKNVLTI